MYVLRRFYNHNYQQFVCLENQYAALKFQASILDIDSSLFEMRVMIELNLRQDMLSGRYKLITFTVLHTRLLLPCDVTYHYSGVKGIVASPHSDDKPRRLIYLNESPSFHRSRRPSSSSSLSHYIVQLPESQYSHFKPLRSHLGPLQYTPKDNLNLRPHNPRRKQTVPTFAWTGPRLSVHCPNNPIWSDSRVCYLLVHRFYSIMEQQVDRLVDKIWSECYTPRIPPHADEQAVSFCVRRAPESSSVANASSHRQIPVHTG